MGRLRVHETVATARRDRIGAHRQATDRAHVGRDVLEQLVDERADEEVALGGEHRLLAVDVEVRRLARGEDDLALFVGERLQDLEQSIARVHELFRMSGLRPGVASSGMARIAGTDLHGRRRRRHRRRVVVIGGCDHRRFLAHANLAVEDRAFVDGDARRFDVAGHHRRRQTGARCRWRCTGCASSPPTMTSRPRTSPPMRAPAAMVTDASPCTGPSTVPWISRSSLPLSGPAMRVSGPMTRLHECDDAITANVDLPPTGLYSHRTCHGGSGTRAATRPASTSWWPISRGAKPDERRSRSASSTRRSASSADGRAPDYERHPAAARGHGRARLVRASRSRGTLIALARPTCGTITLEPGGQVEHSGAPWPTALQAVRDNDKHTDELLAARRRARHPLPRRRLPPLRHARRRALDAQGPLSRHARVPADARLDGARDDEAHHHGAGQPRLRVRRRRHGEAARRHGPVVAGDVAVRRLAAGRRQADAATRAIARAPGSTPTTIAAAFCRSPSIPTRASATTPSGRSTCRCSSSTATASIAPPAA